MASKRRKKVRKELSIQIRVTGDQKKLLAEAATNVGLGLSSWMLTTCLEKAAQSAKANAEERSLTRTGLTRDTRTS